MDKLIVFQTFDNSAEAHLLKTRLEDEEIEAFIFDENFISLNWFWSQMAGGIKLKIRERDAARASEIYREISEEPATDPEGNAVVCPRCGSARLSGPYKSMRNFKSLLVLAISLFGGVYPFYADRVYICSDCKNRFKRPS